MGRFTYNQLKNKSLEEIQKLYEREQKWINDFVPIDSEVVKDSRKGKAEGSRKKTVARKRIGEKLDDESVKRQKIEDNDKKEELKAYLDIIPGDDEAVNVESLATKYPIVDWKTHILTENMMYYQIIRADGSSKNYKIFSEMLDDFDRQDVLDLYRLVKERFETASPEGYDRLLWGDLITVFEPIHVLLMDTGIAIHMLIEKTYPLTQEMLSRMLSRRLEVDHECEMAYELLRINSYSPDAITNYLTRSLDDPDGVASIPDAISTFSNPLPFGDTLKNEFGLKRESSQSAYEAANEKDRTLMRLEELRFIGTSATGMSDEDAEMINIQKDEFRRKCRMHRN
ncbi:hypothetical protein Tco_1360326 [Tanacetum coccineum]